MAKGNKYLGVDIREVWDWRLSIAQPILFNDGETWVIRIYANVAKDGESALLEEIETDIPTAGTDIVEGQARCYPLLRAIRDKYSRDDIDERRQMVAEINARNKSISEASQA